MRAKKEIAAKIMKTSHKKVRFADDAIEDIKKAITRSDFRGLIAVKKIVKSGKNESSRVRARKIAAQKRKGRRRNAGSKKGSKHSIVSKKEKWVAKIRAQRDLLKELRDKELISKKDYQLLYSKSKGGYFRNKRHIKLYLKEHNMIRSKD
jgi:large subunit ribosomal protein L19e